MRYKESKSKNFDLLNRLTNYTIARFYMFCQPFFMQNRNCAYNHYCLQSLPRIFSEHDAQKSQDRRPLYGFSQKCNYKNFF